MNNDVIYTYAGINLGFFTWRRIYSWVYALLQAHENDKLTEFDMESTDEIIFQRMKYSSTVTGLSANGKCVWDIDVKSLQIVTH